MSNSFSYMNKPKALGLIVLTMLTMPIAWAAPTVSRLTPPSELFSNNRPAPVIARFMTGQRFDLQATLRPDSPDKKIQGAEFLIDGIKIESTVSLMNCSSGCKPAVPNNASIATIRAVAVEQPGLHTFSVKGTQSDGQTVTATGNFEIITIETGGKKIRNIILMVGDGMGAAHRTAARIMAGGYSQGKSLNTLAMDRFPVTGMVKTASLNSIVTDSAPGMTAYVSGNKNDNNEEGVFPDDTLSQFDNPRIEYLSEYLSRTQGKALGIVTTADVFDATPAGNAVHTSSRAAGTGIVDQFFDDRNLTGLRVLMGGGRKWFLPSDSIGSARSEKNDYVFSTEHPHSSEIASKWGASTGALDPKRDLIADFKTAGFQYAPDRATLMHLDPTQTDRLLGLFAFSNMNVALDKIDGRRGIKNGVVTSVVADYGFTDQPMLDEMTTQALGVLNRNEKGFLLMVEGASIDKQAHNMDTERWILDVMEFDRAVKVAQDFAQAQGDTLVIVTADHECAGASLIGGSIVSDQRLQELIQAGGPENLRDKVVGVYEKAKFPTYTLALDGYPVNTDIDHRLLIGYGSNIDRTEDRRTNLRPLQDEQQPLVKQEPLSAYPANPTKRDEAGHYLVTGQVPGTSAAHTGTDIPLSAFGPGAWSFTGVQDNTDVFFKLLQASLGGVIAPDWMGITPK